MDFTKYPLLLCFIFLIFYSCGSSDNNEIQKILLKREAAIEGKDLDLYISCFSHNYKNNDNTAGLDNIKKTFEYNTKTFDSIEIKSSNLNIYLKENNKKADVYQKSKFILKIGDESSKFEAIEKMELENTNGGWKIAKESEVDLFKGFVYGTK